MWCHVVWQTATKVEKDVPPKGWSLSTRLPLEILTKHFTFGPLVHVPLSSWRHHQCSLTYRAGLHKLLKSNQNYWSSFQENCQFEAAVFISSRHWPMTDTFLNAEWMKFVKPFRHTQHAHPFIHTDRGLFFIQGAQNMYICQNSETDLFHLHSTFSWMRG
jgi:hypothetical protein